MAQIRNNSILEGDYQEFYTPAVGPIKSPSTNTAFAGRVLSRVKFLLTVDATLTWRDLAGIQKACPLKAGVPYPFYATEISAVSAGAVLIIHDGEVNTQQYATV